MSTTSDLKRPRSRAAAKEASREALIAAAISLFAEKGIDASLDEICARAGYTRGAFYVHFASRDDLIAAVMQVIGSGWLDAMMSEAPPGDLETIIRRFAQRLDDGTHPISRKGGVRPYQLLDACARSETIRGGYVRLVEEATGRIEQALAGGQAAGKIRKDIDPRQLAALMEAAVVGLEVLHDLDAAPDLDASAAALMTLLKP